MTSQQIPRGVRDGTIFGLIECDVCVPEALREHFAEMQPVFKNIRLTRDDLGPFMRRYAEEHDVMTTPRRMLVGSVHGPTRRRRPPAQDHHRRHHEVAGELGLREDVKYCTEKAASLMVNDRRFRQLDDVVDDAYEIAMNKKTVTYALPVHVGFFVLQYAKMRMLQFYYDFIDRYLERPQYCEMDTDSAYLALAGESVDDLVTPELREHYFRHRSERLPSECCDEHQNEYVRCRLAVRPWVGDEACYKARKAYDKRTPGLFKVEWSGDGFVGLCSMTYYCFEASDKYSTKGLSKRHNAINKDAFLEVLANRRSGSGKKRGFRVHRSSVFTYVQERAALTYFYAKRVVHEDGVSTGPVDV